MHFNSNNKDKSMFYAKMKMITNYDSRWLDKNIVNYDSFLIKRTNNSIYDSKKSIIKYYNVEFEDNNQEDDKE